MRCLLPVISSGIAEAVAAKAGKQAPPYMGQYKKSSPCQIVCMLTVPRLRLVAQIERITVTELADRVDFSSAQKMDVPLSVHR